METVLDLLVDPGFSRRARRATVMNTPRNTKARIREMEKESRCRLQNPEEEFQWVKWCLIYSGALLAIVLYLLLVKSPNQ